MMPVSSEGEQKLIPLVRPYRQARTRGLHFLFAESSGECHDLRLMPDERRAFQRIAENNPAIVHVRMTPCGDETVKRPLRSDPVAREREQ
jgi:hypothetical protein